MDNDRINKKRTGTGAKRGHMKKTGWKKRIKDATIEAGTYQKPFDNVIETLAEILEKRDAAEEMYKAGGSNPLIKHTNKVGATNVVQNPALRLINDLNRDALAYWRDLGLTPAGHKRLTEKQAQNEQSSKGIGELLEELGVK